MKNLIFKNALLAGLLLIFVFSVAGCGTKQTQNNSVSVSSTSTSTSSASTSSSTKKLTAVDEIKKKGTIIIATGDYYPFEYHDPKKNELVGYDIDLGNLIAKKLGVKVQWKEMSFQSLIPTLQNKQADMVIAAMYIKPSRKKVIDMSNSYMKTGMVLVKRTDEKSIQSINDINGLTVGVKSGATSESVAQDLMKKGIKLKIKAYKNTTDYLQDLQLGRVDIAFNDYLNELGYQRQHPSAKLEVIGNPISNADLGIGIYKGESELLDLVNNVIKEINSNGESDQLFKKWLK